MKVAIAGSSTFSVDNLGDDAILASLVQALKTVDSSAEVTLLARHPSKDYESYFGIRTIQNLEYHSNREAEGKMFRGFNKGDDAKWLDGVFTTIRESDLFILAGNLFMEVSENHHLRGVSAHSSLMAFMSQLAGTPLAIFGLNVVDPIKHRITAQQAQHVLAASSLTSIREEAARMHLQDADIDTSEMVIGGDPVFGLSLASVSNQSTWRANQLAPSPTTTSGRPRAIVSACLRADYWKESDSVDLTSDGRSALMHLLDSGALVKFIPNCVYAAGHPLEDDRVHHRMKFGGFIGQVEFVEEKMNLFETVSLLRESDIHITNRRHSAILAAHAGAVPIPLGNSFASHMSGFLSDLGEGIPRVHNLTEALDLCNRLSRHDLEELKEKVRSDFQISTASVKARSLEFATTALNLAS